MILHWKSLVLVILALVFLFSIFGHYVFFFSVFSGLRHLRAHHGGTPSFPMGIFYLFFFLSLLNISYHCHSHCHSPLASRGQVPWVFPGVSM